MASYFLSEALAGEFVPESDITHAYLVERLVTGHLDVGRCLGEGMRVSNVTCTDITGLNGFLARIYKYCLELVTPGGSTTDQPTQISVVLKLFSQQRMLKAMEMFTGGEPVDQSNTEAAEKAAEVHNRECHFYSAFGKLGHLLPLPDIYYVQELSTDHPSNGLILMEDLSECAYIDPVEEGLSRKKVESVVRHLATLHAHMFCLEESEREALLQSVGSRIFYEEMMDDEQKGAASLEKSLQKAVEVAPEITPSVNRLRKSFLSKTYWELVFRGIPKQQGIPPLLTHGDLWTNNILWRKSDSGEKLDEPAAIIDWQGVLQGNPMFDVSMLTVMCCEADVRRELETYILQIYHDELCKGMAKSGRKPPFTVEDLKVAYDYAAVHQAEMFAGFVHLIADVWLHPGLELTEEEKTKNENKITRLKKRMGEALVDAVKILKRVAPEWLGD